MKQLALRLLGSPPIRLVTLGILAMHGGLSRLASAMKSAAIFRGPHIPTCHWSVTVKYPANITCGKGVVIGPKSTLGAKGGIVLEEHVRISEGVMIETAGLDFKTPPPYVHIAKPIHIEAGAWLGARAIVLAGVRIGRGAIIGAGAIITRDVPTGTVVVSQPPAHRELARGKTYTAAGSQ